MIVFRLEDEKNQGPFKGSAPFRADIIVHDEPAFNFSSNPDFVCGWDTVEQFIQFVRFPANVDSSNFRAVIYDVDTNSMHQYPDGQVVFDIRNATPVGGGLYTDIIERCFNCSL